MRKLLSILALGLASLCFAQKGALLVGVNNYARLKVNPKALQGSLNDVDLMDVVTRDFGFFPKSLKDPRRDEVVAGMKALLNDATPDSEVLFYFSGRGSILQAENGDLVPSLMLTDADPGRGFLDLGLPEIEAWAQKVEAKKAHVTIILDTCFATIPTRGFETNFTNNQPKCFERVKGRQIGRKQVYIGPGTFLCASGPAGQAFEWKTNTDEDRYVGTFTDQFAKFLTQNTLFGRQTGCTFIGETLRRDARKRDAGGYMMGYLPEYQSQDDRPLFGGGKLGAGNAEMQLLRQRWQQQADSLRVVFDVDPELKGEDRRQFSQQVFKPLGSYLSSLDGVLLLDARDSSPDMVLLVGQSDSGLWADFQDSEQQLIDQIAKVGKHDFVAPNLEVLTEKMKVGLQSQAYLNRVHKFVTSNPSTLGGKVKIDMPQVFKEKDPFRVSVEAPPGSRVYIFDYSMEHGVLSRSFPQAKDSENVVPSKGVLVAPKDNKFDEASAKGKSQVAVLVVDSSFKTASAGEGAEFQRAALTEMKDLCDAIRSGKVKWVLRLIDYELVSG